MDSLLHSATVLNSAPLAPIPPILPLILILDFYMRERRCWLFSDMKALDRTRPENVWAFRKGLKLPSGATGKT